ncbi:UbiA prenyltransferase family protein [uncultured delta proteobacterium]|uniref:4-hydroxybenzoate polyprenyltransferase n=1 Tax=uncultured delta proteobacterium TaxID=34034 RepID=A0A212KHQ0_9DELT|nr:UbiA prenyltransferase family protein [uncultured delta proteobacterium]
MPLLSMLCNKIRILCRMVKIEHSVFALPFAFMGAFAAAMGVPPARDLILLGIAMVCIRSFAMTFNRIVDVRYDRLNPRTATRPLITGEISPRAAWLFCAVMAIGFVASAAGMNMLCLALSPLVLFVAGFYSYTKRFTWLCHFVLGLLLAMAPMAGYLAVTAAFALPPMLLAAAVTFWVAGFDIFYSCQDVDFDQKHGLHSVPAHFGIPTGLVMAGFCHANTVIFLFLAGYGFGFAWPWHAVVAAVAAILVWEHRLVRPDDLTRVNLAFFTLNAVIALILFCGIAAAIFL